MAALADPHGKGGGGMGGMDFYVQPFRHNNKKGPTVMPGLLRLDAFNQLERLEDQTDQFGIQ